MAFNEGGRPTQFPGRVMGHRDPLAEQLPFVMIKIILALMSLYLFFFGFIFAVCVFMSSSDLSPEISLNFMHHPMRSLLLILLVAVPFVLMAIVGRGGSLAWLFLRLFTATIVIFGVYSVFTSRGFFEGFTGIDGMRRDTGFVYAASSAIVLMVTAIPGLRKRINEEI